MRLQAGGFEVAPAPPLMQQPSPGVTPQVQEALATIVSCRWFSLLFRHDVNMPCSQNRRDLS